MPDRREFLAASAAAALAAPVAQLAMADDILVPAVDRDPRFLGWRSPPADRLDSAELVVEGALPQGLQGVLRRNGPAAHVRHGVRYRHWFDGDGMLQEFRLAGGRVSHRGRMIATPKLSREDAAGRRLYPAFATPVDDGLPLRRPDDMNVANISVLDHHGELMALWEGGSASLLDRETLAWTGFRSWGEGLQGLPFSAHPRVEADGTLWAFGYASQPRPALVLYHVSADGNLVKAAIVPVDPMSMVHDFVITRRHLVLVLPPFVHRHGAGATFLDSHVWEPELGTRVLVVSKDDFSDRRWAQLPAGFGFHHGNGWEEADGTIRFDHCLAPDATLVTSALRDVMQGELRPAESPRYTAFALRPDGRAELLERAGDAEFPVVPPALAGRRNRHVYTVGIAQGAAWFLRSVEKRDLESGDVARFDYGEGFIAEEHVFVPFPDASAEDDGWLVGSFLAWQRGVSGIAVFDARGVSDGPVARAWLPYPLPLGLHGKFSPV